MNFLDRYYHLLRPLRPLYGWFLDSRSRAKCSRRAEEWKAKGYQGACLDVCGGRYPLDPDKYLNVDIADLPQVDLVFDITKPFPLPSGVIEEIVSIATLEHIRKPHVDHCLREFYRVLAPGGLVQISTPDLEKIAQGILNGDDLNTVNQFLFGRFKDDETDDLDTHKWMYPAEAIMEKMKEIGFTEIEQVPMTLGKQEEEWNYLVRGRK